MLCLMQPIFGYMQYLTIYLLFKILSSIAISFTSSFNELSACTNSIKAHIVKRPLCRIPVYREINL